MEHDKLQFLLELSALSRKHKILIGGCGCCGSPFLSPMTEDEVGGEYTVEKDTLTYDPNSAIKLGWELP